MSKGIFWRSADEIAKPSIHPIDSPHPTPSPPASTPRRPRWL